MRTPHQGKSVFARITSISGPVHLRKLLGQAFVGLIQFPVATATGAVFTVIAALAVLWIPGDSIITWYLRLASGAVLGTFGFLVALALFMVSNNKNPHVLQNLKAAVGISLAVGTISPLPLLAILAILPPAAWELAARTGMNDWYFVAAIGIGSLWVPVVIPAFALAWGLHIRFGAPLLESLYFVWRRIEDTSYHPIQIVIGLGGVGAIASFVPYVTLLVIPFAATFVLNLFDKCICVE